jgi:hypothetical protein
MKPVDDNPFAAPPTRHKVEVMPALDVRPPERAKVVSEAPFAAPGDVRIDVVPELIPPPIGGADRDPLDEHGRRRDFDEHPFEVPELAEDEPASGGERVNDALRAFLDADPLSDEDAAAGEYMLTRAVRDDLSQRPARPKSTVRPRRRISFTRGPRQD